LLKELRLKALIALAAVVVLGFAKDNYIFDYAGDTYAQERLERLEREIAELKGELIALRRERVSLEESARLKKLEEETAKLVKQNAAIVAAQKKITSAKPVQNAKTQSVQTIIERPSAELTDRLDKLETTIENMQKKIEERSEITPFTPANNDARNGGGEELSARVKTIADRVFSLEGDVKELKSRVDSSAGLPFDEYINVTKAHIEYFILGLVGFVLLIFFLILIAIGRASRADSKIAQLVKLYQSSSRKSEDRK
jgi:hypothetical protein